MLKSTECEFLWAIWPGATDTLTWAVKQAESSILEVHAEGSRSVAVRIDRKALTCV